MKKIVIISEQGRIDHELIALLTVLFPDCDISIAADNSQDSEPCLGGSFSKIDPVDSVDDELVKIG